MTDTPAPVTATKPPPPPPPPPPAPPAGASPAASTIITAEAFELDSGTVEAGARVLLYGGPGAGKSTLAAWLPGPVVFLDVEGSTRYMQVTRNSGAATSWRNIRAYLAHIIATKGMCGDGGAHIGSIVLDSISHLEPMCHRYIIETKPGRDGAVIECMEDYPWAGGVKYNAAEWELFITDLDAVALIAGVNVCLVAHETLSTVTNPEDGGDYQRIEPKLFSGTAKGDHSVRDRIRSWCDFIAYLSMDKAVKDGKAKGGGTRTVTTQERATHIAKSRTQSFTIPFTLEDPGALWKHLGIDPATQTS